LGPALGRLRVKAAAGEQPYDDEAGERLDQAVCAEADQRDRARGDSRAEGDPELDDVPADPAPSEQSRPTLVAQPLHTRSDRQSTERRAVDQLLRHVHSL